MSKYTLYILDEKTQKPIRDNDDYGDTFLSRDASGNITTVIKCTNEPRAFSCRNGTCNLRCDMYFQIPDLNTRISLSFLRHQLKDWQRIQQIAEDHLRSWIVEPEKNSVVLK